MQALPLIGLSSLRIEGALKANPSPEVLSGQLPPGRLEIPSGRRADVEQCLGKSLIQTLPSHWKVFHSLWRTSVSSEGENRRRQCWSRAGRGRGRAGKVQVQGREERAPRPSPPSTPWLGQRATWNAALQSFPLNSLKLLDGERQYSGFYSDF